jgi:DNA-binding transcriptional LysR family regulator
MVAVLPRNHPLANARRIKLVDLLDTPLILMDRDSSVRRIVDAASASLGRIATPAYEPAFMATAIGMVRAGLGATLLPSSAVEITSGTDLVTHPLAERELTRQIGVLRKRARLLSPAAEAFVRTLRTHALDWFNQSLPLTVSPLIRRQRDEPLSPSRHRRKKGSPASAKRRK